MARLREPFDARVHWIRDLLNRGRRKEALAMLEQAMASGKVGKETRELAEYLRAAKRGRQPFGAKHLWFEIGQDNDEMRDEGLTHAERIETLSVKYMLGDVSKVKTAIAKYEKAMEDIRQIEENNR